MVYLLKSNDEVCQKFPEFKAKYENEKDRMIKAVRTDNGKEVVNCHFYNLFKKEVIHHQKTVPYCPQRNAIAERINRTILDKTRTMLIASGLPSSLWGETVYTASYLLNSCFNKSTGKTPLEMWLNHKPSVSYLKVFGCTAHYYKPKCLK